MGWKTGGIPDEEFGGDHSFGTGTYEARTPEQARALYNQLPKGSRAEQQQLEAESRREHPELWGQPSRRWGDQDPEGDDEDEDENDNSAGGLANWAIGQTIFGRILKIFGR